MSDARAAIPLKGSARDPEAVRKALTGWLAPRLGAGNDLALSDISMPGGTGVANETLLFDASWGGHTEGFVARVASERPLYLEADIEVHAKVYEALADVDGVPVPRVYGYEGDPELLGAPFFVMERVDGQVPGDNPPWHAGTGWVAELGEDERRVMWEDAVRVLAALHTADVSRFPFLAPAGGVSGLLDHLAYWRRVMDVMTAGSPHDTLERGYEWLLANIPTPQPSGFSWGDARFANIMFREGAVVAVFDWDTVSLAGAEADLAWWRFMDGAGAALPGIGSPDELVQRWQEHTGRTAQDLEWHEVFTSFRLGNIMLRLFTNMAADGLMPPDVAAEQARNSGPATMLASQLDALT